MGAGERDMLDPKTKRIRGGTAIRPAPISNRLDSILPVQAVPNWNKYKAARANIIPVAITKLKKPLEMAAKTHSAPDDWKKASQQQPMSNSLRSKRPQGSIC